jgi:REP element-mobilizing transposase RayT
MSRGNYRSAIFVDELHASRYLFLLDRVAARRKWHLLDWCLMPNHYHLVVQLTEGGLSEGMRELNGCFSRWSNTVRNRTGTGHLVRNRFPAKPVTTDAHFYRLAAYLPMNPVVAGLAESPHTWRWSGYRATAGIEHPRPFHRVSELLRHFGATPRQAVTAYRAYVEDSPVPNEPDPWSDDGGTSGRG